MLFRKLSGDKMHFRLYVTDLISIEGRLSFVYVGCFKIAFAN